MTTSGRFLRVVRGGRTQASVAAELGYDGSTWSRREQREEHYPSEVMHCIAACKRADLIPYYCECVCAIGRLTSQYQQDRLREFKRQFGIIKGGKAA